MIIETILESNPNLVERHSDKNVYILNITTGLTYASAVDFNNDWRIANGLPPYTYEETTDPIEPDDPTEPDNLTKLDKS